MFVKKIGLFLLLGGLTVMVLLVNCESTESAKSGGSVFSTTLETYYCDLRATFPGDIFEGFHMKNMSDRPVGLVIRQIIVGDSKDGKNGTVIWDFTANGAGEHFWGFAADTAGEFTDEVWISGEIEAAPVGGETYITGNAGPAYGEGRYLVIVMSNFSEEITADMITLVPIYLGDNVDMSTRKLFKDIFRKL